MSFHFSKSCLIAFLLILCSGALPSSADEIEINPNGLTFDECQGDTEAECVEEPETEGEIEASEASEASLLLTLEDLFSGWLESLRARVCGWVCR